MNAGLRILRSIRSYFQPWQIRDVCPWQSKEEAVADVAIGGSHFLSLERW